MTVTINSRTIAAFIKTKGSLLPLFEVVESSPGHMVIDFEDDDSEDAMDVLESNGFQCDADDKTEWDIGMRMRPFGK